MLHELVAAARSERREPDDDPVALGDPDLVLGQDCSGGRSDRPRACAVREATAGSSHRCAEDARRARRRRRLGRVAARAYCTAVPRERDEPVRLTKIYTRGGDAGETSLGDGSRVSKLDGRIAAFGTVDELNSAVGVVRRGRVPGGHPRRARARAERALRPRRRSLGAARARGAAPDHAGAGRRARGGLRPVQRRAFRSSRASCCPEAPRRRRSSTSPARCAGAPSERRSPPRPTQLESAGARLPEPALGPPLHPRAWPRMRRPDATSRCGGREGRASPTGSGDRGPAGRRATRRAPRRGAGSRRRSPARSRSPTRGARSTRRGSRRPRRRP